MEIRDIDPEWDQETYFWRYYNEDDFVKILKEFTQIIIKYGLKFLDSNSEDTDSCEINKDTYWKLYTEHKSLSENFIKNNNIEGNTYQGLESIKQCVKEIQDKNFNSITELLIEMATYYGEEINKEFNGEWKWDEKDNICYLELSFSKYKREWLPLHDIVAYWFNFNNDEGIILELYDELCSEKY